MSMEFGNSNCSLTVCWIKELWWWWWLWWWRWCQSCFTNWKIQRYKNTM